MKLDFIYLPLTALLYTSSAFCSAANFDDEDRDFKLAILLSKEEGNFDNTVNFDEEDEAYKQAIKHSQEESDRQLAITLASLKNILPIEDSTLDPLVAEAIQLSLKPEITITDESYALEESYFGKATLKISQPKATKEEKVSDEDIRILGEIFKKLQVKYNSDLQELKDSAFNGLNFNVPQQDLEDMSADAIQELIDQQHEQQESQLKQIAKGKGIVEPKDQKENMIAEFKNEKNCSRAFAEKAYKEFVGED